MQIVLIQSLNPRLRGL
uniref:Uncharacterized protein n=1 Tax=Anguilla anguilla TaxID=7936 RepID=A0A0E9SP27_ANGAN